MSNFRPAGHRQSYGPWKEVQRLTREIMRMEDRYYKLQEKAKRYYYEGRDNSRIYDRDLPILAENIQFARDRLNELDWYSTRIFHNDQ